jgi:hypothetical protein
VQGTVVLVVLEVVDDVLVDVDVLVLVLVDVDVVNGTGTPQWASEQVGPSGFSTLSIVTRQVSDGSAQCMNGTVSRLHSPGATSQRGALGSTHKHPAKTVDPWWNAWNEWQRIPLGHVPPQVGKSWPSHGRGSGLGGNVVGVTIAGWQML